MDYAIFEEIEKSIFYVKFSPQMPNRSDFDSYLENLNKIIYQRRDLYFIMDASYAPYIPSDLRKQQAFWMKKHERQIIRSTICTIYIIPNSIQRSILNAIYLIQKPSTPYKIVSSYKYAVSYLSILKDARKVA